MGETTKIEWTHHTFNPWIGCTKVHTGCTNCYAEAQNGRWAYNGGIWGKGAPRKVTSESNWKQPLKWAREAAKAGERRRVFCASLADVLDEEAPPEAQERLWDLIRLTACYDAATTVGMPHWSTRPGLDWLLLTKRPERWQLIPEDVRSLVWLGTSISDQKTADEWVPRLIAAQGFAKRFLSIEPQVGPVHLQGLYGEYGVTQNGKRMYLRENGGNLWLDWVICGGESGPGARPFDIAWARSLRDQCRDAGVAFFCKQLGAHARCDPSESPWHVVGTDEHFIRTADKKGGDWSEWPADLKVREFPSEPRREG